jgi:hypothetical protein
MLVKNNTPQLSIKVARSHGTDTRLPHPQMAALSSLSKTAIVVALGFLLAWRPRLAAYLGKLVCAGWRRFPEV